MLTAFQLVAGLFCIGLAVLSTFRWLDRQDTIKLNNDPFTYLFGRGAEQFVIAILVAMGATVIFSMFHLYVLAGCYLASFAIRQLFMIYIYNHVIHLKSRGRFYGRKPSEIQPKRVHLVA
jgi:hypothetical protein